MQQPEFCQRLQKQKRKNECEQQSNAFAEMLPDACPFLSKCENQQPCPNQLPQRSNCGEDDSACSEVIPEHGQCISWNEGDGVYDKTSFQTSVGNGNAFLMEQIKE